MLGIEGGGGVTEVAALDGVVQSRKEKRKALKKQKRKEIRRELAVREREEEEAQANDPEEQLHIRQREQEEAEAAERERKAFEEHERLWLEAAAARRAEEERREEEARRIRLLEDSRRDEVKEADELGDDGDWEYVEEGPAEIIWKGNEIIVKKKQIRVKRGADKGLIKEADDRPTSNPLPPQSVAFEAFNSLPPGSVQEALESVAQQVPNFGTEQDKAHCPFHLKTGACRFGTRCSRVHFYPDKSCTLLIKNMYTGPGIAWEQDEGLEYTDEEVERCYEEFYEDVHTEFLKFGELVNFKVCRNGSFHLRGNVYIHYKTLESAILAYNTMNGRYYAGKQITCEFVNITRWKIAICGEYMKSRLKTCSHGTACNFVHCFHNPGGDYEWADWDSPPPRHWVKKMAVLFGPSDGPRPEMDVELENRLPKGSGKKRMRRSVRYHSRSDRYHETGLSSSSGGEVSDGNREKHRRDGYSSHRRRSYSRERRKTIDFADKLEQSCGSRFPDIHRKEYSRYGFDSGDDMLWANDKVYRKEEKSSERSCIEDDEHIRKQKPDSSNRWMGTLALDGTGKSEKKSTHHRQMKMPDLLDSGNGTHKVNERYSNKPRPVDIYPGKELHKRNKSPDFDLSDGSKESHRSTRSKYRSHYHKHDNETKYREQQVKGDDSSYIESLDDCRRAGEESYKMHDTYLHRGSNRSHHRSVLADSGSSASSEDSGYERRKRHLTVSGKRYRKKREHQAMEGGNGDSGSVSIGLESGKSKRHQR